MLWGPTCSRPPRSSWGGTRRWTAALTGWLLRRRSSSAACTPVETNTQLHICRLTTNHVYEAALCATLTCATAIHRSTMRALWAGLVREQRGEPGADGGYRKAEDEEGDETGEEVDGLGEEGQRSEVMTRLVTALNWETVARTVGASFRFSFLSRWDQMQPRHWKGTTLMNSSWRG